MKMFLSGLLSLRQAVWGTTAYALTVYWRQCKYVELEECNVLSGNAQKYLLVFCFRTAMQWNVNKPEWTGFFQGLPRKFVSNNFHNYALDLQSCRKALEVRRLLRQLKRSSVKLLPLSLCFFSEFICAETESERVQYESVLDMKD